MSLSTFVLVLALPVAAALGGCAGPEGFGEPLPLPTPASTPSPPATAPPSAVRVRVPPGFRFTPDELRVGAGEVVELTLANLDQEPHTFVVEELGILMLAGPGQTISATVSVHPDRRGTFPFYCRIPGHREAGMEGRITVR